MKQRANAELFDVAVRLQRIGSMTLICSAIVAGIAVVVKYCLNIAASANILFDTAFFVLNPIAAGFLMLGAYLRVRARRREGRRCPKCSYRLFGLPRKGVCPECGAEYSDESRMSDT